MIDPQTLVIPPEMVESMLKNAETATDYSPQLAHFQEHMQDWLERHARLMFRVDEVENERGQQVKRFHVMVEWHVEELPR